MDEPAPEPIEIPCTELSPQAMRGIAEAFVLREGTEYGERDYTLDEKVRQVLEQIERGEARILFDPASETVAVVKAGKTGVR